ncbi:MULTISPECIES: FKBP-type peptidyl-prolyl cis-trans isomerase [Microbacterium]|uniref:FKBP-type peptidyl-prolyl cis-trans isomerase n=1 Tax=Microbacterium TaxID=33882 RepID=UPI00217CCE72|nr:MULTISPECIES: FKBP-type peptidyl-prolyl cis-trans isomerase [Microbacterium]UWF78293.1 FKBP-type peptidyl-prolyl cis-trans isomerase [Microbacterium neungamense]WCM56469.1 FKBP-type peptidyl-prolyl cis-trans isomerase [Microbacterium sp. EF45047]
MRLRPVALLSTIALAGVLLTACAGEGDAEATPTPSAESSCVLDKKSGPGSDAVQVEGSGLEAKVTVPAGTEFADAERTVVSKGDGEDVLPGDLISVRYQLVDAVTNQVLGTSERGPDGVLPVLLNPNQQQQLYDFTQSSIFLVAAECEPIGSEIVLTLPSSMLGEGQNPVALYVQTLEKLPTVAKGAEQEPQDGMATVKLDDKGEPTIGIPEGDAPTETTLAVLKKGDGAVVGAGDLVTVQYRGVKWSDGEEFDSTWTNAAFPAQFPASGVVTGFRKGLEGQTVGSQVLVEIPPAEGYGAAAEHELKEETLVFVIDILGTTPLEQ